MFLRSLFKELEIRNQAIPLCTDSQPVYDHITKNLNHSRTKHIHRRFNFAQNAHLDGEIELQCISATDQVADILTKVLPRIAHAEAIKLLNMCSIMIPV